VGTARYAVLKLSSGTRESVAILHRGPALIAAQASRRIEGHPLALMGRKSRGSFPAPNAGSFINERENMENSEIGNSKLVMGDREEPILQYFSFAHLPAHLQDISKLFHDLAWHVAGSTMPSAERTVALRKLLEGKDAAVRAKMI